MPTRRSASPEQIAEALERRATASEELDRADLKLLCRHFMTVLVERAPGRSVEVRVPPFAAAQVVPGPRHTRGTPPAVVEMGPETWLALAVGELAWADAETQHLITASGERADLSDYLPLR